MTPTVPTEQQFVRRAIKYTEREAVSATRLECVAGKIRGVAGTITSPNTKEASIELLDLTRTALVTFAPASACGEPNRKSHKT